MSEQKVNLGAVDLNQPQPGEAAYLPPTEVVPLPSNGKVYPPDSALAGATEIEIRAMTAKDEDILTSRALLKSGKAIDTLLRSCLVSKAIDPEGMVVGDRNAVMVAIRITGYGSDYRVEVECPNCNEKARHEFDLAKLPLKNLEAEPVSPGTNEFAYTLPVSKKKVTFKILTGADEKEITTIIEKSRKSSPLESLVTTRLQFSLLSMDGTRDGATLAKLIRNMPARDSRELRAYMEKISPGIDMKQEFECSKCGVEQEVDVPMGTEFFWPSAGE